MVADEQGRAAAYACLSAVQSLVILLAEESRVDREHLSEVLEDAAAHERELASEDGDEAHTKAAGLIDQMVQDVTSAKGR
jgi:CheY-like chemotaxis protein